VTRDFARNYLEQHKCIFDAISLDALDEIIEILSTAYEKRNSIFIFGNGGSGITASHFACDINKGVSAGLKKRFRVICLNDNIATMLAYANDMSYPDIFVEQLKNFLEEDDVTIGISGSGNSSNVINAIRYANENGAKSIAFTGFKGGELARIAQTSIIVPTDDMQKIEDLHAILSHIVMQILYERVRAKT